MAKATVNVAQLCREFGISRETGYCWLRRFRDGDHDVRSPTYGPRVLHQLLCERHAELEIPKPSTIAAILRRRGLSSLRADHRE